MLDATPPVTTRQVSVAEAARELGISPETVRRWIKLGRLEARRAIRPQGAVWQVSLPVTTPRGVPPVRPVTGHSEASRSEPEHTIPAEAWHPSPPLVGHTMDPAPLVASIARLIAELAEVRVISDHRADQLVSQAETIGRQSAELERGRATIVSLGDELAAERAKSSLDARTATGIDGTAPAPFAGRLRPLIPWLMTSLAIVAVVVLLAWPR
jgi:transposase-like protein